MKKICNLLFFMLILSAAAKAQTDWVTKKIDEKLSIKFPIEPQRNSNNVYLVKGKDSVSYSAGMVDMKVMANLDSATLATMKDTQKFADAMLAGIASKKANYTFGAVTIGKWKTFTTHNVSAVENNNKSKLMVQIIFIGSRLYSLSCNIPDSLVTRNNEVFFDSVEILDTKATN